MKINLLFILTIFLTILVACTTQPQSASIQPAQKSLDVWSKNSSYSVSECDQVCAAVYDMKAQVSVCQNNCDNLYRKPGASLDRYVNAIKDVKNLK